MEILGNRSGEKVEDLIRNGGIIKENLFDDEAKSIASNLMVLFAVYEVLPMPDEDMSNGFKVVIVSPG